MLKMEVKAYYDFVLPLVREAGQVETKDEIYDEVTEYDRKIENILIRRIKEKWPHHNFIGEEESHMNGIGELTRNPTWIIDPIDGTSNFVRNMRDTCISVGLVIDKEQIMGIVFNPFNDELYTAVKGQGAFLNGLRIHVNQEKDIKKSIFNYELSLARNPKYYELYMYRLKHLIQIINGFRSLGSAVLGLCYVAVGRLDAYQCDGLYPWDAAAGVLIVREAGGYVCDTRGGEFDLMDPNFLATSTKELSDQFMEIERKADEERLNDLENKKPFKP
ncbi:inositol monophosphatase 1-like isoform X2 [Diorhabda sublineata]|uniref:inositol monophosphatase 1-like isoform X2 n=1 Tax=Diorhabda sublineata TaxID=1163346 RepID=UPI0024E14B27|nr:inositol monophosphatase 1-like isoform X2 [Diorhabda sublineata]